MRTAAPFAPLAVRPPILVTLTRTVARVASAARAGPPFTDLVLRYPQWAGEILARLKPCLRTVDQTDAKVALLNLIGDHGDKIEAAPYLVEAMIDTLKDERSPAVRLALLSACAKLFFKRPPETQAMLGRLLNKELSGDVPYQTEPHDRALLYYRLLSRGIEAVRSARA